MMSVEETTDVQRIWFQCMLYVIHVAVIRGWDEEYSALVAVTCRTAYYVIMWYTDFMVLGHCIVVLGLQVSLLETMDKSQKTIVSNVCAHLVALDFLFITLEFHHLIENVAFVGFWCYQVFLGAVYCGKVKVAILTLCGLLIAIMIPWMQSRWVLGLVFTILARDYVLVTVDHFES